MGSVQVQSVIDFAVGETWPDLTLLLSVPIEVSEQRRAQRSTAIQPVRDRFEELDRDFFRRVETGFREIANANPGRVKVIDATQTIECIHEVIWGWCQGILK